MKFSAVLLAGGESRRMGRDKTTIIFDGQPLWLRQLEVLRGLHPAKIFVSARTDPPWRPIEIELLLDEHPSRGPLSGLTRALQFMPTSHLIALAVDMPFMTSGQMQLVCDLARNRRGVLPAIENCVEPLAAVYAKEVFVDFLAAMAGTDFSLQRLSRAFVKEGKMQIFKIPKNEQPLYRSVNEPGDLTAELPA